MAEFEKIMREQGFTIRDTGEIQHADEATAKELEKLSEDNPVSVNEEELQEFKFPPNPVPFFPLTDSEKELQYKGPKEDVPAKISHKLMYLWVLWAQLRLSTDLEECLSQESDKESVEYRLKSTIVELMDRMAKILVDTDLKEEFRYLLSQSEQLSSTYTIPAE